MEQTKYELLGIEISYEEFDHLMCEQSNGKELVVENGKVVAREHQPTEQELANNEIQELKIWFSNYYTEHEQKYRRLNSIGKLTDEGKNPYQELITLYNEAETKRARIQELERLIND